MASHIMAMRMARKKHREQRELGANANGELTAVQHSLLVAAELNRKTNAACKGKTARRALADMLLYFTFLGVLTSATLEGRDQDVFAFAESVRTVLSTATSRCVAPGGAVARYMDGSPARRGTP